MFCARNSELGEIGIKQGISQGHSLSAIVFLLALIPLSLILRKAKAVYEFSGSKVKINVKELDSLVQRIHIFNKGMGMDFSTEKCATERKYCEISWYRVTRW